MTSYDPPRPWTASYPPGVPEDLEPVSGSLVDIVAASARDYADAPALQFFGRGHSRPLRKAVEPAHFQAEANRLVPFHAFHESARLRRQRGFGNQ